MSAVVNPLAADHGVGARGGPVPPMTVEEAQQLFAAYKQEEYGWLRAQILRLAKHHGEFHADQLAQVALDERNVIGAAVHALVRTGVLTPTTEHRRGQSSASHSRRSYVYHLTAGGEVLLSHIERHGGLPRLRQPKGDSALMELNKAKALVALAIRNETFEGELPTDPERFIEEGQALIEQSIACWGKNIRGPEIESLLMLDANWEEMGETERAQAVAALEQYQPSTPAELNGAEPTNGANPFAPDTRDDGLDAEPPMTPEDYADNDSEPEPEPEPEAEPEAEGRPTLEDIDQAKEELLAAARDGDPDDPNYYDPVNGDEPFDGYDKTKIAEIKDAFANDYDQWQIAVVQLYEAAHRNRPGIVNWKPSRKPRKDPEPTQIRVPAEPEPQPDVADYMPKGTPEDTAQWKEAVGRAGSDPEVIEAFRQADERQPTTPPEPEPAEDVSLIERVEQLRAEDQRQPPEAPPAQPEVEDGDYRNLISDVKARHEEEALALPAKMPDERVEFPLDLRQKTPSELQHLHWSANAYAARCAYVLSLESRLASACKHLAEDRENQLLAECDDKATMTIAKARIAQDPEIKMWRRRERKHTAIADDFRKQREIYLGHVDALSRQHTMRTDERATGR